MLETVELRGVGSSVCEVHKLEEAPYICVQLPHKTTEVIVFEEPWQQILGKLSWLPDHETITAEEDFKDKKPVGTERLAEKALSVTCSHLKPRKRQSLIQCHQRCRSCSTATGVTEASKVCEKKRHKTHVLRRNGAGCVPIMLIPPDTAALAR